MSTGRWAQRGWNSRGWNDRQWFAAGAADGVSVDPTDGWKSCEFSRVAAAPSVNRAAVASEVSRVVWANPQGK